LHNASDTIQATNYDRPQPQSIAFTLDRSDNLQMQDKIISESVGVALGKVTVKAMATVKVNLAVQHMLAAARFSREVHALESQHKGQQFGDFWEGILHYATASVLASVASLEAYANELFSEREKLFPAYSTALMNNLWETYEQKPILEKFAFALLLLRKPDMDRGARPYQDVKILIELRNALTHFKPEWMNEPEEHAKISAKLPN
jgi:hypothetical protein